MRGFVILSVALALAALLFVALRGGESARGGALQGREESEPVVAAPGEAQAPPEPELDRERAVAAKAPAELPAAELEPEEAPAKDGRALVRGRFLLPGGVPAVGAGARLDAWQANDARVMAHGLPEEWQDLEATTDAEGRLELRLDPPRAYQFSLDVKLPGYAAASWRWSELLPGSVTDLGTVELAATGSIRVRMVDAQGEPIRSGWTIYADSAGVVGAEREATRVIEPLDPSSASALLEDLPAGTTKLKAHSRISSWVDGPTVDVEIGREQEALIRYEGPDESRRIVVGLAVEIFHTLGVELASVRLSGGALAPGTSVAATGYEKRALFEELAPGSYTVEIDDPRYEPWSRSGVEPGTLVTARLRGSAKLRVRALDAASGALLPRYDLRLRLEGTRSWPHTFQLLAPTDGPPADGLFEGVPPVPATLLVAAEGFPERELPLEGLAPGELRAVEIELARGATVTGRVLAGDGATPIVGAQVQLAEAGAPFQREGLRFSTESSKGLPRVLYTDSDEHGRFTLSGAPPGTWTLRAIHIPWLTARVEDLELLGGAVQERSLTLPPAASLRGRLLAPEGASFAGLRLSLRPSAAPVAERLFGDDRLALELAADGAFEAELLPVGEATLFLAGPEVSLPNSFSSSRRADVPELELARLELAAGAPNELELDLRERWFGSVRVRVTRDGAPLAGYVAELRCAEPGADGHSGALTDDGGVAAVGHLTPGDWLVRVRPLGGIWSAAASAPVTVRPGRESSCTVDVVLAAGTLTLLDRATGEPLRENGLMFSDATGRGRGLRTDAEGRLELELAPGTYTLRATERSWREGPEAQLEWTATGPATATLELELPAQDG